MCPETNRNRQGQTTKDDNVFFSLSLLRITFAKTATTCDTQQPPASRDDNHQHPVTVTSTDIQ